MGRLLHARRFRFRRGHAAHFLARDEADRGVALAAIGPVWNGNEVWLITAGGATFAAFPLTYASMFSFLYLPMLLILFSLIVRGVSIEFRGKSEGASWRSAWDWALAITSFTAPLVLGLGFGNIFQGLPSMPRRLSWRLLDALQPYGLLTALLFVLLFLQHGALWLAYTRPRDLAERARDVASVLWYLVLVVAAAFLVLTGFATRLYDNYLARPLAGSPFPCSPLRARRVKASTREAGRSAPSSASCATIVLVIATALVGLFPNLIPSSLDPAASLTAFNSSSGPYTLRLMAIVALVFVPIVIVYQFLVYRFFRHKLAKGEASEGAEGY